MHPQEAHRIFGEILQRTRNGILDWHLKKSKVEPKTIDFACPGAAGDHGVEIGSEHVDEYGTVYEFRVVDDAGEPLYEYALSHHAAAKGEDSSYKQFVELFTLARHIALGTPRKGSAAKAR